MPLQSIMFSGNKRLQDCFVNDLAHVTTNDNGDHVALIQASLVILDGADIKADGKYGPRTEAAVLQYKKKNNIINTQRQTRQDGIVGKMTIAHLDKAMNSLEAPLKFLPGPTSLFKGLLFFSPKVQVKPSRIVIVTETTTAWLDWANQVKKHYDSLPGYQDSVRIVQMGGGLSVQAATSQLASAAALAGSLGILVISVGHGAVGDTIEEGAFDLAPNHKFQLCGRPAWLVGQPAPKKHNPLAHPSQASAFYADRPPVNGGFIIKSDLENDQASNSVNAKIRVDNFRQYEKLMNAFRPLGLIVLVTCKVAGASAFLQKVKRQFGTPILAYKRRVTLETKAPNGRIRAILEGDSIGSGTNVPTGEFMVPISPSDMTLFL